MEKTRPKISFVPREFTPFFSRASCSLFTFSSSASTEFTSVSSFSVVSSGFIAMVSARA